MGKTVGQYIAKKMAKSGPLTKQQMLRKWPSLGSIWAIDQGINWIEANTGLSDNPFLVVPVNNEWQWGFRSNFHTEVRLNLWFNMKYLITRSTTFETVLAHAINSPVVAMTANERRIAKAILAQVGGTIAFMQSMEHALR